MPKAQKRKSILKVPEIDDVNEETIDNARKAVLQVVSKMAARKVGMILADVCGEFDKKLLENVIVTLHNEGIVRLSRNHGKFENRLLTTTKRTRQSLENQDEEGPKQKMMKDGGSSPSIFDTTPIASSENDETSEAKNE